MPIATAGWIVMSMRFQAPGVVIVERKENVEKAEPNTSKRRYPCTSGVVPFKAEA